MDENILKLNNKVIALLVAVVVTAVVLVPLCNAFSNDGGSGGGKSSEYVNPGQWLYKLDLSDTSNEYVINLDDVEVGQIALGIKYSEGSFWQYNDWEEYWEFDFGGLIKENESTFIDLENGYGTTDWVTDKITIRYTDGWAVYLTVDGVEEEYPWNDMDYQDTQSIYTSVYESDDKIWIYAGNVNDYADDIYVNEDSAISMSHITYNDDVEEYIGLNQSVSDISTANAWVNGRIEGDYFDIPDLSNLEYPVATMEDDSKLHLSRKDVQYDFNGVHYTTDNLSMVLNIPHSVQIGGNDPDGSDKGIAGTIIAFIPVFVLLAILGSAATLFISKDEEITE